MTQPQSVAASGASFTTGVSRSSSRTQLQPKPIPTSRTIVETALCLPELKRGPKGWSMQEFKIQRVLGEGALSTVFHGICTISGLSVALKVYHRDKLNSLNVKQVGREIDIHASCSHPNIIKLYAAFEDADGIYLVQEFATGGDLYAELARHGGYMLEAHVVKHVMKPFLTSISHLHSRGILHRDIKPENILLTSQGEIKVADFGLAIDTTREKPVSRVGTLDYMPPEIAILPRNGAPMPPTPSSPSANAARSAVASLPGTPKSPSPLGAMAPGSPAPGTPTGPQHVQGAAMGGNYGLPVDVWCSGILAYELLVGGPPFEADTKDATYTRILKTEPFIPASLSPGAQDFIRSALQKNPALRPTIDELLNHPWLKTVPRTKSSVTGSPATTATSAPAAAAVAAVLAPVPPPSPAQLGTSNDGPVGQASAVCAAYVTKVVRSEEEEEAATLDIIAKGENSIPAAPLEQPTPASSTNSRLQTPVPKKQSADAPATVPAASFKPAPKPLFPHKRISGTAGSIKTGTAAPKSPKVNSGSTGVPSQQAMRQSGSPLAHAAEKLAKASAIAEDTAEGNEGIADDLIGASYGDGPAACTPASVMQMLARPPAPASGSSKTRRPRILSAYLKKLNISNFMGLGNHEKEGGKAENKAESGATGAAGEPDHPHVRLSRLAGGAV